MTIRKNNDGIWYFNFGSKRVEFSIQSWVRVQLSSKEWVTIKIKEITFNDDIDYVVALVDENPEPQKIPFQCIIDAHD